MLLSLESQAPSHLLESSFHLPAPDEPADDSPRFGAEVATQQGLGSEFASRVPDQPPAQGHGGQPRTVPDGGVRNHLYRAPLFAVPVGEHDRLPAGGRIFGNNREVRQPLTLEAR